MTEDLWVGSWRPHHPRGPIMALYTSPGPKYMIPGTTGFVKHTPTKPRAPAYSFRGAPTILAENYSPGPRYSVNPKILRTGRDMGPAYSILGRYEAKTIATPGPGEYSPEKSIKYVFNSAPSHSISARTKSFRVDSTPDPRPCCVSPDRYSGGEVQGPTVHHGCPNRGRRGQDDEAGAGRSQPREGDDEQAHRPLPQFWNQAFRLHDPAHPGRGVGPPPSLGASCSGHPPGTIMILLSTDLPFIGWRASAGDQRLLLLSIR
ncbi:outer dense fiber protein 3 isoform X1 [Sarcophilus harrisii]|uniref:outer dense fiber protein 3 isoform X1 n=1 Tax=Sarcophilus harrisii TaxID=9305 RepID=UPI001301CCF6|nr:outer dense fiber protein 3 isoform X1 [Sarcophilus harrisii]